MKAYKRGLAVLLFVVMLVSTVLPDTTLFVRAATQDTYGEWWGTVEDMEEGKGIGRDGTLVENWEKGLNQSKWEVVKYNDNYISDYQIVDDPVQGSGQGKVLQVSRTGSVLVPTDAFYPNGARWGELKTVEFKLYFKDIKSQIGGNSNKNGYVPGAAFRAVIGEEDEVKTVDGVDGFLAWSSLLTKSGEVYGAHFYGNSTDFKEDMSSYYYRGADIIYNMEDYVPGFDFTNWINVQINVDKAGNATATFTDSVGNKHVTSVGTYNNSGGKFAIGYPVQWARKTNVDTSTNEWGGQMFVDDIKVTFQASDFDKDEAPVDVDVYYEGNTFLSAGDTISLTGEHLGDSVLRAKIAKMNDTAVDIDSAQYVEETHYDAYYDVEANTVWNHIDKSTVLDSTDNSDVFTITQRSDMELKMVIPKTLGDGMYAVLLEAADAAGKDELVIINNPRITILMGDDGDYASSKGWLKIGGENLSVQNDSSKVSVIILDEKGNKLRLLQNTAGKEDCIYVDTKENYGVENEHYMQIFLDHLNLQPGTYQIMVHNGYGGAYGWSMPYTFRMEEKAANVAWQEKGIFNVQDYGAVGDGEANDTAAIQRAINAAVENGGGTVYFPKRAGGAPGSYRITKGLIVGENISFVGDGVDDTILFYSGYLATTVEQTEYFISYERNFEITEMELYCNTNYFKDVIKNNNVNSQPGKLYIHNIKCNFDAQAWRNNSYTLAMPNYEGKTASEWYEIQWMDTSKCFLSNEDDLDELYFLYDNNEMHIEGRYSLDRVARVFRSDYADVTGLSFVEEKFNNVYPGNGKAAFYTECGHCALGSNSVYRKQKLSSNVGNNRESFLADTGGINQLLKMTYVNPATFRNDLEVAFAGLTEKELAQIETLATEYAGRLFYCPTGLNNQDMVAVINGKQGVGQIRTIEQRTKVNGHNFIVVDKAFAVNPNRNSTIAQFDSERKPSHTYVIGGEFNDASIVGPFGTGYDFVFNNCKTRKVSSMVANVNYSGFMWYYTMNGLNVTDISSIHNDQAETDITFFQTAGAAANGITTLGARLSNATFEGYLKLNVTNAGKLVKYGNSGTTIEHVEIISETPALYIPTGGIQGLYIRDVKQYTDSSNKTYSEIVPYNNYALAQSLFNNGYLWADNVTPKWMKLKGDINGDDVVNLEDLTVLRNYLAGLTTLNEEQLNVANMNNDYEEDTHIIDARDFLCLRAYILLRDDASALKTVIAAIGRTGGGMTGDDNEEHNTFEEDIIVDFTGVDDED